MCLFPCKWVGTQLIRCCKWLLLLLTKIGTKILSLFCSILKKMSKSSANSKGVVIKGLPNIGNTCFMNSVLQCLIWTPNFKEKLEEQKIVLESYQQKEKKERRKDKSEGCLYLTHTLSEIVKTAHESQDSCWLVKLCSNFAVEGDLKKFLKAIRNINSQFEGLRPQDSYEMFNTIIPGLEDELMKYLEGDRQFDYVSGLFTGEFRITYKYPCKHNDEVYQRFTSISIPVRETGQIYSLEDGLKEIAREEKIPLKDLPCSRCTTIGNESEYCFKQLLVSAAPEILVIHINRFKQQNRQLVKIQEEVKYPLKLDLSPFVTKSGREPLSNHYSLYGVICHDGSITGGHYYSLIKACPRENVQCSWFRVSDRTVEAIECPLENASGVYMLMYQRNQELSQITSIK